MYTSPILHELIKYKNVQFVFHNDNNDTDNSEF